MTEQQIPPPSMAHLDEVAKQRVVDLLWRGHVEQARGVVNGKKHGLAATKAVRNEDQEYCAKSRRWVMLMRSTGRYSEACPTKDVGCIGPWCNYFEWRPSSPHARRLIVMLAPKEEAE